MQQPVVRLTPIRTIGTLEGPPEYAFGQLGEIAVDKTGRLYTYDEKDHQLRVYDAAGKFVAKIGRRGSGPGEYQGVVGIAIVADSFVAVHDPGNARITLFEPSGKLYRTISELRATSWGGASFFADNAGRVFVRIPVRRAGANPQSEGPGAMIGAEFLGFDTKGRLVDSIPVVFPQLAKPLVRTFTLMLAEGTHSAFVSFPRVVPAPNGSLVGGTGETMKFTITPRVGATRVVEQPWTPVALTSAERSNWEEWATYFSKQDEGRFTYSIPTKKPAYNDIKIDLNGRIWVSIFAPAEKRDIPQRAAGDKRPLLVWRQRATFDVYSPTGALLGRAVLPPLQGLIQATGDQVFAMGKGPDDEQIITVYRMSGLKP
ncbi:MAG: 6-bladed beta-propeller [Gemmatimonas sp.]